ncbi:MAG TPA: TPM domain-containing protein [Planctomycetota bacterium]|nr:TPM domain-containing protein [Planctomycetota bacterium]
MKSLLPFLILALAFTRVADATEASHVRDEGKFFSADAIKKAETQLAELKARSQRSLMVETYEAIPSSKTGYEPAKKEEFFAAWGRERLSSTKERGILVLICREPTYLYVAENSLTKEDRSKLTAQLLESFKKKEYDQGLASAVEFAETHLGGKRPVESAGSSSASAAPAPASTATSAPTQSPSSPWGTIIVIAVAVLGFLFVLALFRSMAGGGMGGGGGGFFSGLMGGIAGAFLGNWLYNSFSGGTDSSGENGDSGSDASADDIDGGGGDFGGDGGGGDF